MNGTFEVNHDAKQITVCMDCHPGTTIFATAAELAGVSYYDLSHGVCKRHAALRKLAAVKRALSAAGIGTFKHS